MSTGHAAEEPTARHFRYGDRQLRNDTIIRTFAQFTEAAAKHHTPCFHGPDMFFEPSLEAQAKAACGRCPLRDACLDFALEARQNDGVWGGYSEDERRRMLAARQRAKQRHWRREREARATNTPPLFEVGA